MANDKPICDACNAPANVAPWGEHFCGKATMLGQPAPDFGEGQWFEGPGLTVQVAEDGQLIASVEGPEISDDAVLATARELFRILRWEKTIRDGAVAFEGSVPAPGGAAAGVVVHQRDGKWIAEACPQIMSVQAENAILALSGLLGELSDMAEAADQLLGHDRTEILGQLDKLQPKAGDVLLWQPAVDGEWPHPATIQEVARALPGDVQVLLLPKGATLQLLDDAMLAAFGLQRIPAAAPPPPAEEIDAPLECVLCGDPVGYDDSVLASDLAGLDDGAEEPRRCSGSAHRNCAELMQSPEFSDHRAMLWHVQNCPCETCTSVKDAIRTRLRPRRICIASREPHALCRFCKLEAPAPLDPPRRAPDIRDGEDSSSACARACAEAEELEEAGWKPMAVGGYTRRGWTVEIGYLGDRVHQPDTWIARRPEGGALQGGWPSPDLACKAADKAIDQADAEEMRREAGDPAQPLPPNAPLAVLVSQFLLALPGCRTEALPADLAREKPMAGDQLLVKVTAPRGEIDVRYVRAHDAPLDGPLGWRFVTSRDFGRYSDPLTTVQRAVDELQGNG